MVGVQNIVALILSPQVAGYGSWLMKPSLGASSLLECVDSSPKNGKDGIKECHD